MLSRDLSQNQLHILPKSHVQHLIRLVQNHHVHMIQLDGMPAHMVHHTSGGSNNNLDSPETADLPADILAAVDGKHFNALHVFGNPADLLRRLHGQLPGGAQDNGLQFPQIRINLLQGRNAESSRLARARLGLSDNVLPLEQTGNRLFLNGGQLVKSHFSDGPHNALIQKGFNIRQTVLSVCPFCASAAFLTGPFRVPAAFPASPFQVPAAFLTGSFRVPAAFLTASFRIRCSSLAFFPALRNLSSVLRYLYISILFRHSRSTCSFPFP